MKELTAHEHNLETLQRLINGLTDLKHQVAEVPDSHGIDCYINNLAEGLEEDIAQAKGSIDAAKATTEKQLIEIAVEQIMRWWHSAWVERWDGFQGCPPTIGDKAVRNAVDIVLTGRETAAAIRDNTPVGPHAAPLAKLFGEDRPMPSQFRERISRAVQIKAQRQADEAVAESHRLHALRDAVGSEARDRELLNLPPEDELSEGSITSAQRAAEAKAGPAKNGKPYPRFASAAARLLLLVQVKQEDQ